MMRKATYRKTRSSVTLLALGFLLVAVNCRKTVEVQPDPDPGKTEQLTITGVSLPGNLDAAKKEEIVVIGKGFAAGDVIILHSTNTAGREYTTTVMSVNDQSVTFTLPSTVESDRYRVIVRRGEKELVLGTCTINIVFNSRIPDKEGMTIKGVVHAAGKGVADVVVSDGFEVTKTDESGIYYLPSNKRSGYIFISVPGNYEVTYQGKAPLFFRRVQVGSTVDIRDFALTPVNNDRHVVVALADMHLANRNNDLQQFGSGFLADANTLIRSYQQNGGKVYGLTLGDMTWETYWYTNNYDLVNYIEQMNRLECPVFHVMGNHDHDPYHANDWYAEGKYRSVIGPTYYSFNLGKVHYIVLDNTNYVNTGGIHGISGDRTYHATIVQDQMEWLKRDLATIEDKNAPLVIAMHIQLYNNPSLNASGQPASSLRLSNSNEFLAALNGFSNIHILSGHTHINYTVEPSPSLMEHNTAAISATWWWTGRNGYANNHICKDGSPGGYGVWEITGNDLKWYYKSIGYDRNYQFRAYDRNTVHITAAKHAPASTDAALAPYAGEYATASTNNEILINVWGYDEKWKVEVTEEGRPLSVTRVYVTDPLHIISYSAKRLQAGAEPTSSFVTGRTAHMFKAHASSATSPIQITVTDRFGQAYTETMTRPKDFTYSMK